MPVNPPSTGRDASRFRRLRAALLATTVATALVLGPVAGLELARAQNVSGPAATTATLPSLSPLVQKVMPAVVNISVVEAGTASDEQDQAEPDQSPGQPGSPFDQYLHRFFQNQSPQQRAQTQEIALGSGFIIDPSGLVVTNNHVVNGAKKVTVVLQDGTKYDAKILGRDAKTDLALLKIDAGHSLPYVTWGDSHQEKVGDWVVAIGNPFGLGGTVSAGIISARGRDIGAGPYDDFLQIDAPINRGNSGGPTFDLQGDVVGINTAIYSPNGGSVGIGFAIPSNLARSVVDQLREHGKVTRGWLGVQIQEVTPALAKAMGLPNDHGAVVADVTNGSPAQKAGIKPGDVIESFNGHDVTRMRDLPLMVADTPVGSEAKLEIWRDKQETAVTVPIAEQPAQLKVASGEEEGATQNASTLGLRMESLTPELHRELRVPEGVRGVVVRSIADSSPLASIDLQPGDVIESVNQHPVTTPEEAVENIKQAMSGSDKRLVLLLNRHGVNEYVALTEESNQG
jgi:serine protease Do